MTDETGRNEREGKETPGKDEERLKIIAKNMTDLISGLVLETAGIHRFSNGQTRVAIRNRTVIVNIHVVVDFGKPIPALAREIQKKAKDLCNRHYPDFRLSAVNVWVDGVHFDRAPQLNNLSK